MRNLAALDDPLHGDGKVGDRIAEAVQCSQVSRVRTGVRWRETPGIALEQVRNSAVLSEFLPHLIHYLASILFHLCKKATHSIISSPHQILTILQYTFQDHPCSPAASQILQPQLRASAATRPISVKPKGACVRRSGTMTSTASFRVELQCALVWITSSSSDGAKSLSSKAGPDRH